jgi:hypothetical protein
VKADIASVTATIGLVRRQTKFVLVMMLSEKAQR